MSDDKNSLILCPIFAASMPFVLTVTLILNHRIEVHFSNFSKILRFEWHRQCHIPVNHLDIIELHTHKMTSYRVEITQNICESQSNYSVTFVSYCASHKWT